MGAADEVPDHDDDQLEPNDEGNGEELLCARRARPLAGGQQAQPTHRLQQAAQPARQLGVLGRRFLEKKKMALSWRRILRVVTWQPWQVVFYLEGCEDDTSHTRNLAWLIKKGQCNPKQLNKYSFIKN